MTKLLKIILFLTILSFEAYSQENNLEHFSISDGLIKTSINDITQDNTGYLWTPQGRVYAPLRSNQLFTKSINTPCQGGAAEIMLLCLSRFPKIWGKIPAKLVQAGYKDGYSLLDALKGQENDASFIEDIATDPLNLVGLGLVSKGANAAKLIKAYKNLSKLSNAKRTSTLQNAYKLNPFAFKPNPKFYYRGIGKEGAEDALESGVFRPKQNKKPNIKLVWLWRNLQKQHLGI